MEYTHRQEGCGIKSILKLIRISATMKYTIGTTYTYFNDEGDSIIAKMVEPEEIDGRPYVTIDGSINGNPVKTMPVPVENVEMALSNHNAREVQL